MAGKIKGITVAIGGDTSGLTKAIDDVDSSLRKTQSELKSVESALKLDPNNISLVKQKQDLLNQSISDTEKKLKLLKDNQEKVKKAFANNAEYQKAYQPLKKQLDETKGKLDKLNKKEEETKKAFESGQISAQKYEKFQKSLEDTRKRYSELQKEKSDLEKSFKDGHIDESQYRAFQRELETTKKKLENLKGEKKNISVIGTEFSAVKEKVTPIIGKIEKIGTTIGGVTTKTAKFTAALAKIDGKMISAAADGFKKYSAAVGAASSAIAGMAVSQASNLDTIDKQSQALGLSRQAYQEWDYVLSQNGVDIESFGTGMKSLLSNMDKANEGNETAVSNFERLGVSVSNADGSLRNQEDVLKDVVTAFQEMEDGADKTRLATELFGKQGQSLMPLLNGEAGAVEDLMQKCNDLGMVVSDETVDAGVKFTDALDTLKRSGQGLFNTFASTDILETFTDGIYNMTDGVSELLAAYNQGGLDALVEQIPITIENMFSMITEQIGTKAPILISAVTTVLSAIITSLATQAPSLINSILPTLLTGFFGLIQALVDTVPTLVPMLVDGAITLFLGLLDGLNAVIEQLMPMLPDLITRITDTLVENLPAIIEGGFQLLIGLISGIANCTPELINAIVDLIPVITQAFTDNLPALVEAGISLIIAVAEGLPKALPTLIKAIPDIFKAVVQAFSEQDWLSIGKDVLGGIIDGLKSAIPAALEAVVDIGGSIVDGFCDFFDINSPSRVMAKRVGQYLPPGIGVGMETTADEPVKKAQSIVDDVAGVTADMNPITIQRKLNNSYSTSDTAIKSRLQSSAETTQNNIIVLHLVDNAGMLLAKAVADPLDIINGQKITFEDRG